ncbi:MAG: DUF2997 domain-containing protein [Armatimonadetes bacterium]|jgi:hypothetical protein|nr:DUF2997 domain-containing protein [Armatimonadota bacterium]
MVASKQQIEFRIHPNGEVEFVIKGVKGRKCADVARLFETLGTVTKVENTGEYYERETETRLSGRNVGG